MPYDMRNDVFDHLIGTYGWIKFGTDGAEITKVASDGVRYSVVKSEDDGKTLKIFSNSDFYVGSVDCYYYSSQGAAWQVMVIVEGSA